MDWIVRLGGDEWTLQGLCGAFRGVQPRVWREDDGRYYLSSPALSLCADEGEAWRDAERAVSRINDAAALDRGHHPVVAEAVVRVDSDGTRRASAVFGRASTTLSAVVRSRASATVSRADGTVEPPGPSRLEKLYAALERDGDQSHLARALQAWRSRAHDWALLYHVYEIIKDDVSGGTRAWKALQAVTPGGMTWSELNQELVRFRKTANDPAHAGLMARHGGPEPNPIADPMQLPEADDLIWRLLQGWIETKV